MTIKRNIKDYNYLLFPIRFILKIFFFLIVLEAGFQLYNYLKSDKKSKYYYPSICCGYKLNKNNTDSVYKIDSGGFRRTPFDYSSVPQSKVYKIVIMGASETFGWTNAENLHYPAYLEFILNSSFIEIKLPKGKQHIDIINAGIPAQNSHFLKNYLEDSIIELKPDMVIVSPVFIEPGRFYNNSPVLWFLEKNIQIFYWYFNNSTTFSYLDKIVSPGAPKTKKIKLEKEGKVEQKIKSSFFKKSTYLGFEKNLRKIVQILKDNKITPVLLPKAMTSATGNVEKFTFGGPDHLAENLLSEYKMYAQILEKISDEFHVPLVRTPLQIPIIPKKHSSRYFTTDNLHLNNYGAKIVGLSLANAIKGILEGKNNEEIYQESFTSIPGADLLDLYTYIVLTVEPSGKERMQKPIEYIESRIANYCLKNTRDDMSIPNYHFSECFFAIPDAALYQMRQRKYQTAKRYLEYATNRYPKWAYPYFIYGLYHLELGNNNEAKLFFKKAIQLAPFYKLPQQYINQLKNNLQEK